RNRFAEDGMKDEQVVDRLAAIAEGAGELGVAVEREAVAEQGDVERGVALGEGTRRGVAQQLALPEVFEEAAHAGLAGNGRLARHGRVAPPGEDSAALDVRRSSAVARVYVSPRPRDSAHLHNLWQR